jgi:N-acetyl-gamma-glutamyl-phosphate reductase
MTSRVFVDGHVGTTGLRIREWLAPRADLSLVELPESRRKDPAARKEAIASADVTVLCLPDDAAREAAGWAEVSKSRVIDASSAHRTANGWVFGLPELEPGQRQAIARARAVSNTGCWSTAVLLLLRPVLDAGLVARDAPLTVHGLSGYSGGGRDMIARWEDPTEGLLSHVYEAPYALDRVHKHVPEIVKYSGLAHEPVFVPAVGPFRCGMRVELPLPASLLARNASAKNVWESLDARYRGEPFVRVLPIREPLNSDERSFDPRACNDTNRIELRVIPHPSGHVLLVAVLDNLGKGAAGVAIQNLNLMLGLPETEGLLQARD